MHYSLSKRTNPLLSDLILTASHECYDSVTVKSSTDKLTQFFTFYCSYDHPHILSGQGTIGVEILEQVPDVDAIIVPVGGGGLLAGLCVAVKSIRPEVMIVVSRFQRNIYS